MTYIFTDVYMYAGAYTENGILVAEHTSQPQPANNPGEIDLQFGDQDFEDTDVTIDQFFLELHVKVGGQDSTHPWGYTNKFISAKEGLCINKSDTGISYGRASMWKTWKVCTDIYIPVYI